MITKVELKDLVCDLRLSKNKTELLRSRLKEEKVLLCDVCISTYCDRHKDFLRFYEKDGKICFSARFQAL